MSLLGILILALIVDAIVGDPDNFWRHVPHPAALMGRAVSVLERRLNNGKSRRLKGLITVFLLAVGAGLAGWLVTLLPFSSLWETIAASILLAHNSLMSHVTRVARGLEQGLDQGREAVAMIVGRDVQALDQSGIARSAIESAAENFSDGVVAPAFWFLAFGLPGMLIYKVVNTADSMIGYRTDRYRDFGWAAARLDDLLNLIPARLSGLLICAVHFSWPAFRIMRRDAPLHRSPNAGWPEAAAAAVVNAAISGPRSYNGAMTDDPFVNPDGKRYLNASDIDRVVSALWRSWAGLIALLLLWGAFTW